MGEGDREMSCRRAFVIDLADFLSEPGREEFAEFREHYPVCPECAAEVRAWTDLHVLLQSRAAGPNGGHPEPEALLRYEQGDARLGTAQVAELEGHLARCPSCRDELSALRGFDFSVVGAEAPRGLAVRARIGAFVGGLQSLLLHPAFAYALVLVLLYPAAMSYFSGPDAPELFPSEGADETALAQRALVEEAEPKAARRASPAAPPETRANVLRKERALRVPTEAAGVPEGKARPRADSAAPAPSPQRLAPAEAPARLRPLPEVTERAARRSVRPEEKKIEADLPVGGRFAYKTTPAPPQAGVAGEAAEDRPAVDVYEPQRLEMKRQASGAIRMEIDRPPWILRLRVPDEVRGAARFEVRVVHPDGRSRSHSHPIGDPPTTIAWSFARSPDASPGVRDPWRSRAHAARVDARAGTQPQ
jgi:hypothetical protein